MIMTSKIITSEKPILLPWEELCVLTWGFSHQETSAVLAPFPGLLDLTCLLFGCVTLSNNPYTGSFPRFLLSLMVYNLFPCQGVVNTQEWHFPSCFGLTTLFPSHPLLRIYLSNLFPGLIQQDLGESITVFVVNVLDNYIDLKHFFFLMVKLNRATPACLSPQALFCRAERASRSGTLTAQNDHL
jgi:hypothetical protein